MVEFLNLSNIKPGQIIKKYAEFCNLLGEEVKGSTNSKRAQEKEWQRYLTWEKDGHKYIILEVKETPRHKIDGRGSGNHKKYTPYTVPIMLDYLYGPEQENNMYEHYIEITDIQIYLKLGICNSGYDRYDQLKEKGVGRFRIDNVLDFYKRSNSKLYEIRSSTLNNLKSTGKIKSFDKVRKAIENNNIRSVTPVEEKEIKEIEASILNKFRVKSIRDIYNQGKQGYFYKEVNKEIYRTFGWTTSFSKNKIVLNEDIKDDKENILEPLKKQQYLQSVNNLVIDTLNKQAEKLFYDEKKRLLDDYLEEQLHLSEGLIKISL